MFLNIAGGLKVNAPAMVLVIISAILASNVNLAIEQHICLSGEMRLSGEIRTISRIEQHILEAEKLGFSKIIIPNLNLKGFNTKNLNIEIIPVRKVEEAFRQLFG